MLRFLFFIRVYARVSISLHVNMFAHFVLLSIMMYFFLGVLPIYLACITNMCITKYVLHAGIQDNNCVYMRRNYMNNTILSLCKRKSAYKIFSKYKCNQIIPCIILPAAQSSAPMSKLGRNNCIHKLLIIIFPIIFNLSI